MGLGPESRKKCRHLGARNFKVNVFEKPSFSPLQPHEVICSDSPIPSLGPLIASILFFCSDIWPPLGEQQICFLQKPSQEITREEAGEPEKRHFLHKVSTLSAWECVGDLCL